MNKKMMVQAVMGERKSYVQQIRQLFGSNLLLYLANVYDGVDFSGNNRNVTPANVTQTDGVHGFGGAFNGTTSIVDFLSVINSVFNRSTGSIILFSRIAQAAWDDNLTHGMVWVRVDGNNYVSIQKEATARVTYTYDAAATVDSVVLDFVSTTAYTCYGITWDKPNEIVKVYRNGVQAGQSETLGDFSTSALVIAKLGVYDTDKFFLGDICDFMVLDRVATPTEMASVVNF